MKSPTIKISTRVVKTYTVMFSAAEVMDALRATIEGCPKDAEVSFDIGHSEYLRDETTVSWTVVTGD